jgi:HlyD family secretion protein
MLRKYLLPILAIAGAIFALFIVFLTQHKLPTPPILFPPAVSPYENSIAGAGIIEASSLNIPIGSPFSEIVTKVYVVEGQFVKQNDPLFDLDIRTFEAQAKSSAAAIEEAKIAYEDRKKQFSFYERLRDKTAVSEQQYQTTFFAMKEAEEQIEINSANLKVNQSNIERSHIRAPMDAFVLQVNIRPGQVAPTVPFVSSESTLMLLGKVDPLHVRIDIDEDDCWRYKKGARAQAFVRGNSHINFPLEFVRLEPYIIPKASYTGDTTERIDTRVLQVLYSFKWDDLPVYPGQIVDIFIEADPINLKSSVTP